MARKYTQSEKAQALQVVASYEGSYRQAAAQLGIPAGTLRHWTQRRRLGREARIKFKLEQLREQIVDSALRLSAKLDETIASAPLNQIASALGVTVDRCLKLDEYLASLTPEQPKETVIRLEYRYPDGTIHDCPPWANDDFERYCAFPSGGVRTALREDGDGQTGYPPASPERREMLVARPHVPDGESSLARFEDDFAADYAALD